MNRRSTVLACLTALSTLHALHGLARAQPRPGRPTMGYLGFRSRPNELDEAFTTALGELGYVQGRNIVIERRFAGGSEQRLQQYGAELVALKPDILMASSFQSTAALARLTQTIPIVFMANADPVGSGFVASLARPGGNITGLATLAGDLGAKQIELLQAVVPRLTRLGMLVNPSNPGNAFVMRSVEQGARSAGVTVRAFEAATADAIDAAFAAMAAARMQAVTLAIDGFYIQEAARIAALALRHKLPSMTPQRLHADAGSLMSLGSPLIENFRRAAIYADKILKGARVGELPVEQPTAVELVINLRTARALGVVIPRAVLVRADGVIG
jgi:putative ABC transport system substrate-binding protein